jgi:hypothetical protein
MPHVQGHHPPFAIFHKALVEDEAKSQRGLREVVIGS